MIDASFLRILCESLSKSETRGLYRFAFRAADGFLLLEGKASPFEDLIADWDLGAGETAVISSLEVQD